MMGYLRQAWSTMPGNARGAVWVTIGTVFFALNDVAVKSAGLTIHPFQLGFFRYSLGFILLVPLFIRLGREGLRTERLGLHALRAVIAGSGQIAVFYSVIHLILADATAISFSRPLFMTLLAVMFLGEVVGWRRWTATAVGFLGVIVVARPGDGVVEPAALVGLAAALLFSIGLVLIRRLGSTEPPTRILFYYHAIGAMLSLGPAIWVWKQPVGQEWLYLLMIGVLTTLAMVCFVRGFVVGEVSVLGPMEYIRLVYAAALGYLIFAEVPGIWTWLGSAIIVASAIYIARREAFAPKQPRPASG
jgi:drug/metabolite transporter (DMT)-like permease